MNHVSGICSLCDHAVPASPLHEFWECPRHQASLDPAIVATQNLLPEVWVQLDFASCFWLRGLLPTAWVADLVPATPKVFISLLGDFPPNLWPGGTYFTDGSGGLHSKVPALRRCGCGIAMLNQDATFLFGVFPP